MLIGTEKKIACTPIHSGSIFHPAKPSTLVYQGVNSFSGFVVVPQIAIVYLVVHNNWFLQSGVYAGIIFFHFKSEFKNTAGGFSMCFSSGWEGGKVSVTWSKAVEDSSHQKKGPWLQLVGLYRGWNPTQLYIYIGIKINHYKDPYYPASIIESRRLFFSWLSWWTKSRGFASWCMKSIFWFTLPETNIFAFENGWLED